MLTAGLGQGEPGLWQRSLESDSDPRADQSRNWAVIENLVRSLCANIRRDRRADDPRLHARLYVDGRPERITALAEPRRHLRLSGVQAENQRWVELSRGGEGIFPESYGTPSYQFGLDRGHAPALQSGAENDPGGRGKCVLQQPGPWPYQR